VRAGLGGGVGEGEMREQDGWGVWSQEAGVRGLGTVVDGGNDGVRGRRGVTIVVVLDPEYGFFAIDVECSGERGGDGRWWFMDEARTELEG